MKTLVTLVLDESGSMGAVQNETIRAVNEYFGKLKSEGMDASASIIKFDTRGIRRLCKDSALADVPELTTANYQPNGGTPLYDAVGKAINEIGNDDRAKLIVIQTDGQENSSKEYDQASIEKLIGEKTAAGWQFVFLGADQNAWTAAKLMGIAAGNTVAYDSANIGGVMAESARATMVYAASGSVASAAFTGSTAGLDMRSGKNPAAVELGKLGGLKGGYARAASLTGEQRSDIARKAANTRWGNDEESEPIL